MKKLMIIAAATLLTSSAFAQKPVSGTVTGEVNLSLTTGPTTDVVKGISFRYFIQDAMAISLGFAINTNKQTNTFTEFADGTGGEGTQKIGTSSIIFSPGIQKHFKGSDKVSPYVGLQIPVNIMRAKEEWDNLAPDLLGNPNDLVYSDGTSATITGGTYDETGVAGTSFGVKLVGGADWHFTDGMYLGIEFGWGFSTMKEKDVEIEVSSGGTTNKSTLPGGKNSGLGASTTGGLRFGFKF